LIDAIVGIFTFGFWIPKWGRKIRHQRLNIEIGRKNKERVKSAKGML
jgi:hypothetical protein